MSVLTEAEAFEAGVRSVALVMPRHEPPPPTGRRFTYRPVLDTGMGVQFAQEFSTTVPDDYLLAVSHLRSRDRAWLVVCPCGTEGVTTTPGALSACSGCDRVYLQVGETVKVARVPAISELVSDCCTHRVFARSGYACAACGRSCRAVGS